MNYRPQPGYCYQWDGAETVCPRTQNWDTTIYIDGEYPTVEFRGKRTIDGSLCAIFFVGTFRGEQRYIAQLEHFCKV